jgi:hypothetical protein
MNRKRTVYSYDGLVQVISCAFFGVAAWIPPLNQGHIALSAVVSILCVVAVVRWIKRLRAPFLLEDDGHLQVHTGDKSVRIPISEVIEARINWLRARLTLRLMSGELMEFAVPSLVSKKTLYKVFPEFDLQQARNT